ncbi:hypothetical protein pdam_00003385 [Pocillopora damicornis]|uniref:Uncharacterized protein n=1 Tax=Pocillopora damicornis TaxID=46731 RepID=A0A3M6TA60_POCDA|nr:hypothetical protein pdam_00003385 [Pocillopora damicornis]
MAQRVDSFEKSFRFFLLEQSYLLKEFVDLRKKNDRDDCHGGPNSECHTLLDNNDTILTEEQIKAPHMKERLQLAALDCTALCYRFIGEEWSGMDWTGLDRSKLNQIRLDWAGLRCSEQHCTSLESAELDCSALHINTPH